MRDEREQEPPNNACVLGRKIRLESDGREATIVAFDPSTLKHTIRYETGGEEKTLALKKQGFTWLVNQYQANPTREPKEQFLLSLQKDAVGRKIEVHSKKYDRFYEGKVLEFQEKGNKHKILFRKGRQTKLVNLENYDWRFTDLVKGKKVGRRFHDLTISQYVGVQRSSLTSWKANLMTTRSDGKVGRKALHFRSEKDAALAYDVFARKLGRTQLNFQEEQITEGDVWNRNIEPPIPGSRGTSKYRGVHWEKKRKLWKAQYSFVGKGQKTVTINLGTFCDAKQAALAFDAEARGRGRPDSHLNFPDESPSMEQIESWKMNQMLYSFMGARRKLTSHYRGVSVQHGRYVVKIGIKVIVKAYNKKDSVRVGCHNSEQRAALLYDRICRRHGIPEKELNFPRHFPLSEVRHFDDECYSCQMESPKHPMASPCSHVFCTSCVAKWPEKDEMKCPCCGSAIPSKDDLRAVSLIPGKLEGDCRLKTCRVGKKRSLPTMDDTCEAEDDESSHASALESCWEDDERVEDSIDKADDSQSIKTSLETSKRPKRTARLPTGTQVAKDSAMEILAASPTTQEGQGSSPSQLRSSKRAAVLCQAVSQSDEEELTWPLKRPKRRRKQKPSVGRRFLKVRTREGMVVDFATCLTVFYLDKEFVC